MKYSIDVPLYDFLQHKNPTNQRPIYDMFKNWIGNFGEFTLDGKVNLIVGAKIITKGIDECFVQVICEPIWI